MALPVDFTFNISPEWLIEKMPTNQVTDKFLSYKSAQWAPDSVCLICQRRFATSIYHDAPHFPRRRMLHLSWHSEPTTLQQLWALWSSTLRFPQPHDCFRVGFICLSFTHHCLQLPFFFFYNCQISGYHIKHINSTALWKTIIFTLQKICICRLSNTKNTYFNKVPS